MLKKSELCINAECHSSMFETLPLYHRISTFINVSLSIVPSAVTDCIIYYLSLLIITMYYLCHAIGMHSILPRNIPQSHIY